MEENKKANISGGDKNSVDMPRHEREELSSQASFELGAPAEDRYMLLGWIEIPARTGKDILIASLL